MGQQATADCAAAAPQPCVATWSGEERAVRGGVEWSGRALRRGVEWSMRFLILIVGPLTQPLVTTSSGGGLLIRSAGGDLGSRFRYLQDTCRRCVCRNEHGWARGTTFVRAGMNTTRQLQGQALCADEVNTRRQGQATKKTPKSVLPLSARHLKWLWQAVNGQLHSVKQYVTSSTESWVHPVSLYLFVAAVWPRVRCNSSVLYVYTVNTNKEGTYTQRSRTWLDNANPYNRQCSGPSVCM
jgi:hypothetical protein